MSLQTFLNKFKRKKNNGDLEVIDYIDASDFEVVDKKEKPKKDAFNDNPYLTARREWNDHVGSVITQKQTWQFIGVLSLLIALMSVAGVIFIANRSQFIPYIVEVDSLGQARAANILYEAQPLDPRIIHATVAEFIRDSRLVTPDVTLQAEAIFSLYAKLLPTSPATEKMNEYLNANEKTTPFARAKKEMVSVEIRSAIPQSPETWQVDWLETVRSREGKLTKNPALMRALITVKVIPPSPDTTEDEIRKNPLGIYITDYSWTHLSNAE